MHRAPFSRKLRQLHLRIREWNRLVSEGDPKLLLRKIALKIKALLASIPCSIFTPKLQSQCSAILFTVGVSWNTSAQSFSPPVENPFGFTVDTTNYVGGLCPADLDGDGDYDLIMGGFFGTLDYIENTGTAQNPNFAPAQTNPFGLTSSYYYAFITAADLDNDGDLDIVTGEYGGNHLYYQNIGTPTNPFFSVPVVNALGLSAGSYISMPEFADLDNDGDYDIMTGEAGGLIYFENQGDSIFPGFAAPLSNPFDLAPNPVYFSHPTMGDLDMDGDLDMLVGETGGNFRYIQNLANANAPLFDGGQLNPFGITGGVSTVVLPEFVDIDGDGDLDILATTDGGSLWFYENTQFNLGIQEMNDQLAVGPNPFQDELQLSSSLKFEEVSIYDAEGRLVFHESNPVSTLELTFLAPGMYSIVLRDENQVIYRDKLIKR
ncbi:MAG: T9SS type A sorting domain-containing protein [bacterium]|nr:T9SS type A sorting domain-containing protein [bacterium]